MPYSRARAPGVSGARETALAPPKGRIALFSKSVRINHIRRYGPRRGPPLARGANSHLFLSDAQSHLLLRLLLSHDTQPVLLVWIFVLGAFLGPPKLYAKEACFRVHFL